MSQSEYVHNEPGLINLEAFRVRALVMARAEVYAEMKALYENLTNTQNRCNELLEENRKIKALVEDYVSRIK